MDQQVVNTVTMETTRISSSLQSSLTGSRVAGGSVGGGSSISPPPPPPPPAPGGSGSAGAAGGSSTQTASNNAAPPPDEGGDDEGAGSGNGNGNGNGGGEAGGAPVGNANFVVDMRAVNSLTQKIDTTVTSSGNSSLWSGEDGLGGIPGVNP
jgi:hypothetical protein